MIGGVLSVRASRGEWAKRDEKKQRILLNAGIIAFLIGLLLTVLIAILQIWRDYSTYLISFWMAIWSAVSPVVSWNTILYLFLILVVLFDFRWLRMLQTEKGYTIQADEVVKTEDENVEANILVENVGKGDFYCLARLVGVQAKTGRSRKWKSIDIKEINPDGNFLAWNGNQGQPKLIEGVPQILSLIDASHKKPHFLFYGGKFHYPKSPPLSNGVYKIEIDFLRIKKGKQVKILGLVRELTIETKYSNVILSWKKEKTPPPNPRLHLTGYPSRAKRQ